MSRPKYDTPEKLQKHIDTFFSQNPTHTMTHLGDMGITSIETVYSKWLATFTNRREAEKTRRCAENAPRKKSIK